MTPSRVKQKVFKTLQGLSDSLSSILLGGALIFSTQAFACPNILEYIDTNCDGSIRFMLTGDSIVRGVGDEEGLGYPKRLKQLVGDSHFKALNLGVPGTTPRELRRSFIRNIDKGGKTTRRTRDIDYTLIQVGTNSYWTGDQPFQVVMQIHRLKKYIERALEERNGTKPIVFTATVPMTERSFQNPFLSDLNTELLRKQGLNVLVRFDKIPVDKLAIRDSLHPGAAGYKRMARRARKGLEKAQPITAEIVTDQDFDNLYDAAEIGIYFTNPTLTDTDEDELSDGEEVLIYKTNPLLSDTDGDGASDYAEIQSGTDPLIP